MNPTGPVKRPRHLMDIGYIFPSLNCAGWRGFVRDGMNAILGVHQAYDVFQSAQKKSPANVFLGVLEEMDMVMDHGSLDARIPESGAAVLIANHPFGGSDAIALSGLCIAKRPDTKVLANAITAELPGTGEWTIALQILGEDGATRANRVAMKEALAHLRSGGVLIVFPSGAVSRWRNDLACVADPEWSPHVARLATKTGSPVLPVKFFDRNPNWYEILGALHPILRSALIVRVFLGSRGQKIRFRAGEMIGAEQLREHGHTADMTEMLRMTVESIQDP